MVRSLVPGVSFPHEVKQPLQVVGVGLAVEQRALSPTFPHFGSHSAQTEIRRSLIFTKITKANNLQKVPSDIVISQLISSAKQNITKILFTVHIYCSSSQFLKLTQLFFQSNFKKSGFLGKTYR